MRRLIPAIALLASCGGTSNIACSDLFAYGLDVHVVSASTGAPICDSSVSVTVTDGAYQETLAPVIGGSCTYVGAGERAGTYRIDAKAGSSEQVVTGIVVTKDACHVEPQSVTITL